MQNGVKYLFGQTANGALSALRYIPLATRQINVRVEHRERERVRCPVPALLFRWSGMTLLSFQFPQYEPDQPDGANHIPHTCFNQLSYLFLLLFCRR